jgi:hypothetical protein
MCDIKTFDSTLASFSVKCSGMALGKPSKKTTKAASESKAKPVSTSARSKGAQAGSDANGGVAEGTVVKSRKKSAAVVNVDSDVNVLDNTTTGQALSADAEPLSGKTMAAAASSSVSLDTPPVSGNAVSVGHSAAPTNDHQTAPSREAVAELAYQYWAERGYAHGFADEDWARAEAELSSR